MDLSHKAIEVLAFHVVARHLQHDTDDWLCWEDLPALDQDQFTMVFDAVTGIGIELAKRVRQREVEYGIDAAELWGRAS